VDYRIPHAWLKAVSSYHCQPVVYNDELLSLDVVYLIAVQG